MTNTLSPREIIRKHPRSSASVAASSLVLSLAACSATGGTSKSIDNCGDSRANISVDVAPQISSKDIFNATVTTNKPGIAEGWIGYNALASAGVPDGPAVAILPGRTNIVDFPASAHTIRISFGAEQPVQASQFCNVALPSPLITK